MIRIDLDVMLARRKMSVTELSARVGITMANLFHPKKRQGKGHPVFYPGGHLP